MVEVRRPITAVYLGIDPGISGSAAAIDERGRVLSVCKGDVTDRDWWEFINQWSDYRADRYALLEHVHSFPKDGVASAFKFGDSYGRCRMSLVASSWAIDIQNPEKWQRMLGIKPRDKGVVVQRKPTLVRKGGESKEDFKRRLKARAQELFPSQKVTAAFADALLLAELCRRIHLGMLSTSVPSNSNNHKE